MFEPHFVDSKTPLSWKVDGMGNAGMEKKG
jgi:hypothetical protein